MTQDTKSVGDKVAVGNLTFFELLVLAFAVGGSSGAECVPEASAVIAAMDRRQRERTRRHPLTVRAQGEFDGQEEEA